MTKTIRHTTAETTLGQAAPPAAGVIMQGDDESSGPRVSTSNLVFIILTFLALLVIVVYVFEAQVQHLKKEIEEVALLQARQLNASEIMELINIQQQQDVT
jgi:hypothetical protein